MATPRDFYEILGVSRDVSADEIQRAYRKLARTYHPDVNKDPAAEDRFKEATEAYEVLSDPETRKKYDAFGHDFRQVPDGVDPDTWRAARAGGRGGERRAGPRAQRVDFGEFDLDDIFGDMFSGGGGRRGWGSHRRRRPRGRDRALGRGGLQRRPPLDHALRCCRRSAHTRCQHPRRRRRRPAHPPGRPGRPGHQRRRVRRPLPSRCGSPRIRATAWRAATSTSTCSSPRGRAPSARRLQSTRRAARPRSKCRPALLVAGVCD